MALKRSFFERLSGTPPANDSFDDEPQQVMPTHDITPARPTLFADDSPKTEGQLPVDVHQTQNEIVIRAFVAGVRPDELSLSIGRDMVEISGTRAEREQISDQDYFTRELFWGSFARTILLPQEVDVDASTATAKDGLLTIVLPKLDKARQMKLRVRSG